MWRRDRWHEETPSVCSALGNSIGRPRRALHITGGIQLPAWPRVGRPAGQGWHARLTRGESGVCIMWAADNYKLASFTHRPVLLTNGSVGWTWGVAAFLFLLFLFPFFFFVRVSCDSGPDWSDGCDAPVQKPATRVTEYRCSVIHPSEWLPRLCTFLYGNARNYKLSK